MKSTEEVYHVMEYEDGSKEALGCKVHEIRHPAEVWEVSNDKYALEMGRFLEEQLEANYPGDLKNSYLAGLVQVYQQNKNAAAEDKTHFIFYLQEEDFEIAAVIKNFYLRAAEIEFFFSSYRVDKIEDFINHISEYVMEKRSDCSSIISVVCENDIDKERVLMNIEFNWCGILHKAFPNGMDARLYEFIPLNRRQ